MNNLKYLPKKQASAAERVTVRELGISEGWVGGLDIKRC